MSFRLGWHDTSAIDEDWLAVTRHGGFDEVGSLESLLIVSMVLLSKGLLEYC